MALKMRERIKANGGIDCGKGGERNVHGRGIDKKTQDGEVLLNALTRVSSYDRSRSIKLIRFAARRARRVATVINLRDKGIPP